LDVFRSVDSRARRENRWVTFQKFCESDAFSHDMTLSVG
jgi:hypothetical protein